MKHEEERGPWDGKTSYFYLLDGSSIKSPQALRFLPRMSSSVLPAISNIGSLIRVDRPWRRS